MTSRVLMIAALTSAFTFGGSLVRAQEPEAEPKPDPKTEPKQEPATDAPASEELPMPPDGWWEEVKGGETATYDMTQMGMQMKMKFAVDRREGSALTFTTTVEMPGAPPGAIPPKTQTIDFADPEQVNANLKMPKGAIKKIGEETITAAGREWSCTVYEIEGKERGQKVKIKLWRSTELLPVFSNGTVKMEADVMGPNGQPMKVEMNLVELGTASQEGTAPDQAPQGGQPGTPGKG